MTTTSSLPVRTAADPSFTVQGYVTDPKLIGYQILTNYESMYWRALVGNNAWSLYEVLRSFCHEGHNTCHPSIRLLTAMLGFEDKRAIIGRVKTVKGKVYQYAGLIDTLQAHELVIAELQGTGAHIHYVFHINLTPGLLGDEQVACLPALLQQKHDALLQRWQKDQQTLEAKRKPFRFENSNKNSVGDSENGGGKFPSPVGNSHRGGGNFPPEHYPYKHYPYNITQASPAHPPSNNNSSGNPPQQTVVVALPAAPSSLAETNQTDDQQQPVAAATHPPRAFKQEKNFSAAQQAMVETLHALGVAAGVVWRLVDRYNLARIEEKLEYLVFLQTEQPDKVKNPRGWLRRAIEENYGPPDHFVGRAARERRVADQAIWEAEQAQIEQVQQAQAQAAADARAQAQAQQANQARQYRTWLTQTYGTTSSDFAFWAQARAALELACAMHPELFQRWIEPTDILKVTEETVYLGFKPEYRATNAIHPGTKKLIERNLSAVAGRQVQVCYEMIAASELIVAP